MESRNPLTDDLNNNNQTESTRSQVEVGAESLFDQFPTEMISYIGQYLSPLEQSNLSNVNCRFYGTFFSARQVARNLMETLAHFLVVKPNVDEVIKMVKANPILLQTVIPKVKVNDTLLINNKPFQLAYGSWNEEMCHALKIVMIDILGSEEAAIKEIETQIAEKFLQDKKNDDQIKKKLAVMLDTVIQAITHEPFNLGEDNTNRLILNSATLEAIDTFSKELDDLYPQVIEKGMHDRLNMIQETLDAYAIAAKQWNYDHNKHALFEDGVLSRVYGKIVSVNIAEDLSQGVYYLQDAKEERVASLCLRNTNINFYSCLRDSSRDFVLSGRRVNIAFGGNTCSSGYSWGEMMWQSFKNYAEQKHQALTMLRPDNHTKSRCVVM